MDTNFINWSNDIYNDIKTNNKKIVLIAGASASGKSYSAKKLCEYLQEKGLSACYFSADNYYKGISRIITEKAFLENAQLKSLESEKEKIIKIVKNAIETTPFFDKFCEKNYNLLKKELSLYGKNISNMLLEELKIQFNKINFDEPFALNLSQLSNDITSLINDKNIVLPSYSFSSGEPTIENLNTISANKNVYIIEGLYVLRDELLNGIDNSQVVSATISCDIKSLLSRRFNRDIKSGRTTYTPEQTIMATLTKVIPSYYKNILPYNKNANFVLASSLTDTEINSKETSNQVKFKLNNSQLEALKMLPLSYISSENQTDYYLEETPNINSNFILRLRFVNGKATKISFKNILDNSQKIEEYDLSDFSRKNKTQECLLQEFLNIGLSIKKVIQKQRTTINCNNLSFKLDSFKNGQIFIEFDNDKNNYLINILKLKSGTSAQYINLLNNPKTSIEREYKFVIDKIPKKTKKLIKITQFYFNINKVHDFLINNLQINLCNVSSARVRVAKENNKIKYYLTLKSSGDFEREEQEIEINKQTAIYLLKGNIISKISKTRYIININNLKLEFDKFENGLQLLEVEVNKNTNYNQIITTLNSLGIKYKDVTYDKNYKNENLAK